MLKFIGLLVLVFMVHNLSFFINHIKNLDPSFEYKGSVAVLNANASKINGIKVFTGGHFAPSIFNEFEGPIEYALYEDSEAAKARDFNYGLLLYNFPKNCLNDLPNVDLGYRVNIYGKFKKFKNKENRINKIYHITRVIIFKSDETGYAGAITCNAK